MTRSLPSAVDRPSSSGSKRLDELLWNGEYFIQQIDDVDAYKYQHGLGCLSDQLIGQFHAHALGLGDLLPSEHVRKAIKSIFDYNFLSDFQDHAELPAHLRPERRSGAAALHLAPRRTPEIPLPLLG